MSSRIEVSLGERSYTIHIGAGLLPRIGNLCEGVAPEGAVLVVSDAHTAPLYAERVISSLRRSGRRVELEVLPAGEGTKSQSRLFQLYGAALRMGLDRGGLVLALGGGVVGDVAGFMAATWLRGVAWVQVPTTLLAMVDSSVGGKTGIDLPGGKNLVGAFHQPALVAADLDALSTLPVRELRAGLAEAVKTGAIRDPELLVRLEDGAESILRADPSALEPVVGCCCQIKADVVMRDERESGERAVLNFGHTFGHALEQVTGYDVWLHGEAISVGMVFAARLSRRMAGFPAAEEDGLVRLLAELGLPVRCPGLSWPALRKAMVSDKKTRGGVLRFVLLHRLGEPVLGVEAPESALEEAWHVVGQ